MTIASSTATTVVKPPMISTPFRSSHLQQQTLFAGFCASLFSTGKKIASTMLHAPRDSIPSMGRAISAWWRTERPLDAARYEATAAFLAARGTGNAAAGLPPYCCLGYTRDPS